MLSVLQFLTCYFGIRYFNFPSSMYVLMSLHLKAKTCIKSVFLNGELKYEVYVEQPPVI